MSFESLISTYGYLAILAGTFLEGETILILGGFAARRGYLDLHFVILFAFIGALFGDELYFFIGRFKGRAFLKRNEKWQSRAERVHRLMDRYHSLIIFGYRYLYGLRTITPLVIGMSRIRTVRFVILNFVSVMIWSFIVAMAGYLFGTALELLIKDIHRYELKVLIGLSCAGAGLWLFHILRSRRSK